MTHLKMSTGNRRKAERGALVSPGAASLSMRMGLPSRLSLELAADGEEPAMLCKRDTTPVRRHGVVWCSRGEYKLRDGLVPAEVGQCLGETRA